MKKIKICLLLVLILFIFSGCTKPVNLEDRNYTLALAFDKVEDNVLMTYSFADLSEMTGKAGEHANSKTYISIVENLEDAKQKYDLENDKVLDFGHLKCIIFGDTILNDKDRMLEIIDYIKNNDEFAKTILVYRTDNANEILKKYEEMAGTLGTFLSDQLHNNLEEDGIIIETIGDLIAKTIV